jgi:nitroreductase
MTLSTHDVNQLKKAPTVDGVLPAIHQRWSPRSFAARDVSPEDLKKVFEAARWAPSSYNEQPWRFLVGRRGDTVYKKIFDSLMPFNRLWAVNAPVLILGAAKSKFSHNDSLNSAAVFDLGAASAYLVLQAHELGLATHQMAGYDQSAARAAFAIPEEFALGSVIALGYQGEPAALTNEQMLAQEVAPRHRKALSDFVFHLWGSPADLG